eukprot:EG_transcript_21629
MALVAPGEPADLRPPPRPGAVARSISPWQLLDAPTLRPSTPCERQGPSTSRQSVGEALQELQSKFDAFSQQVAADVRALQSENARIRGQLQQAAADVQSLQGENTVLRGQLQEVRADVKELRIEITALRDQLPEAGELQKTHQELDDCSTVLREEQDRSLKVVEQLCLKVLAPEFQTDPTVLGLAYSHDNRRCQYTGGILGYMYAVAREGFTSGYEQFTVHVIETGWQLSIGVAVANATRNRYATNQQGVFLDGHAGNVSAPGMNKERYAAGNTFRAGSQVTMRLDFDNRTAAYEVD